MVFVVQAFQHMPSSLVYILLAVFLLLESSGIPLLNTTLLLCTGGLAAMGGVNLGVLMLVAIGSSTLGACTAYCLGRLCGERPLLAIVHFLHIREKRIKLLEKQMQLRGGRLIFVSRIVPYIRPFACFPAGISAMPFWPFFLAALSGSFVWCMTFLLLGWSLGPRWKFALYLVRFYTIPALLVLALVFISGFFCKHLIARLLRKHLDLSNADVR